MSRGLLGDFACVSSVAHMSCCSRSRTPSKSRSAVFVLFCDSGARVPPESRGES